MRDATQMAGLHVNGSFKVRNSQPETISAIRCYNWNHTLTIYVMFTGYTHSKIIHVASE